MSFSYENPLMPNPLRKPDGTLVKNAEEWEAQKAWLRELAQEHMYGTWPGKPENVRPVAQTQKLCEDGAVLQEDIQLRVDYRSQTFDLDIQILRPNNETEVYPTIIANGIATTGRFENPYFKTVPSRGYALVTFPMGQLVPDYSLAKYFPELKVDETRVYPSLPCRTIMAWAWGHSVVADYVLTRKFAGPLISTGASRGGKAALCAAIFDDRFAVAAPTIAGCGGTGCARFCGTTDGSRQDSVRSETIGRITEVFPDWFNDVYATYGSHEEPFAIGEEVRHFPLDANVLRAMVAPRAVFSSDGDEDQWSNPFGTQLGWMAAQPVFDFLGVPGNNCFHMRPGVHGFDAQDWDAMLDFCDRVFGREPREHADLNQPYFPDVDIRLYADGMD